MSPSTLVVKPEEKNVEAWAPPARERIPGGIAVGALMAAMVGMLTLAVVNVFTTASPAFNTWVHNVGKFWMPGSQSGVTHNLARGTIKFARNWSTL